MNIYIAECGRSIIKKQWIRKKELVKLTTDAKRTILFLPPYSPDFNPIEQFWNWFKRKSRELLHNYDSLNDAILTSFQLV